MQEKLQSIQYSLSLLHAELWLMGGVVLMIVLSLFKQIKSRTAIFICGIVLIITILQIIGDTGKPQLIFDGMVQKESFSLALQILINVAALLTLLLSLKKSKTEFTYGAEYCALLLAIVLGGHFLVMSNNFLMVFL